MEIFREGVSRMGTEVGIDTTNSHVHLSHFPRIWVCFLTINRDIATFARMSLNEFSALYEHTAGPAAAVINTAVVERTKDRNESFNYA